MENITALILAAGEGKRMKSDKAKVLHQACGKAMIEWVYSAACNAGISKCVVIVGHKAAQVMDYMGDKVEYAMQEQRLGTGHAVQIARSFISKGGYILILYGDTPLITAETIKNAIDELRKKELHAVVISADVDDPHGYGRIVRDAEGCFLKIVEHRDANEAERGIKEINSGMYIFSAKELEEALDLLRNDNDQQEYYLTDTLEIMLTRGYKVGVYKARDGDEVLGANDQSQLDRISGILAGRIKNCGN